MFFFLWSFFVLVLILSDEKLQINNGYLTKYNLIMITVVALTMNVSPEEIANSS